ncbi:ACT domain-containing protein [Shewanella sp. NIFS-20-20]|uniref:ACT domain-containing protein n=1 Tax=Shewanella sp. NIFS-20-20 TaxID=2853806 RepID=UPI001C4793E0|nr:ACT domain-containing protein [Shewanella sp. NIFS-20-20]MBV7317038.1 ACT domain-containing protein [Shewanella sp. NIFS-20-20]
MRMTLAIHNEQYSVHSFSPLTCIPEQVLTQEIYFIGKTREELSVVVPSGLELDSLEQEHGWRCLEILGPLGFSMTGILARIAATLADAHVSIFTIATFDTDYILVKDNKLSDAVSALKKKGYQIIEYDQ